jgi:hypothetical protein
MHSRTQIIAVSIATALLLGGAPASADHIPGHDDSDPIFPVPIPGQSDFSGGAMWATMIGPLGGSEITNTRFDITFVSDGQTPASELLLNVGYFADAGAEEIVYVETVVLGSDFGFGSGAGTFHGTFETSALNGVTVESFLIAPYSSLDLIVDVANSGGIQGTAYFVDSFIEFDLATDPAPCAPDLDGDGAIGFSDLGQLLAHWGTCEDCVEDLDGDGAVGFADLTAMLSAWGACP